MKKETVTIQGVVMVPGMYGDFWYYLLGKCSIREILDWDLATYDQEDVEIFKIVTPNGKISPLIVKGPYVLNFASAGKEITIKKQEEVEDSDNYSEPEWLRTLLVNEPQELAEKY